MGEEKESKNGFRHAMGEKKKKMKMMRKKLKYLSISSREIEPPKRDTGGKFDE